MQDPTVANVAEEHLKHLFTASHRLGVNKWEERLNAAIQVAVHQIGASRKPFRSAVVFKVVDAAVLKEFANDRADLESITVSRWVGEEPAHSADDQVHSHAMLSRFIKEGDHLHVNERVHLSGDVRAATSLRLIGCRQNALPKGAP